jgi:hypothetical protein
MTTVRRIVLLCGITVLALCSLWSQVTLANPQDSAAQARTDSVYHLAFTPKGSNPEGKAAVDKLLQALGGSTQVNAARTLRQTMVAVQQGQRIKTDQSIAYPDKQAQKISVPQGKVTWVVVTPTLAFTVTGGQVRDLSPSQRASLTQALQHDFVNVLQHIDNPKYTFSAVGKEDIGNTEAMVVDVNADGLPTRWWIAADGKLLQERFSAVEPAEPATLTMRYSSWKSFGGLEYPTKYEVFGEAEHPLLSMTLVTMEVNPALDPKLFQKPAK